MSMWKDEHDFWKDIEDVSTFYIHKDEDTQKRQTKSWNSPKSVSQPWFDSDEEDELQLTTYDDYSGADKSHLQTLHDVQMQVRNIVGNRYRNETIETFFKTSRDEDRRNGKVTNVTVPRVVNNQKLSVAKNIEISTSHLPSNVSKNNTKTISSSSSPFSANPSVRGNGRQGENNNRRYRKSMHYHKNTNSSFGSRDYVDVKSEQEFPPL